MSSVNLIKIVLEWAGYGESGTISWHLGGASSVATDVQLADLLGSVDDKLTNDDSPSAWSNAIGVLPQGQTFVGLHAYSYVNGHSPAAHQAVKGVNHPGASGSTIAPLQVAVVASLRTSGVGRSFRGRQYWPGGYASVAATTARLSNDQVHTYGALAAQWGPIMKEAAQATLSSNSIYWGVFSRTRDVVTPINVVLVDNVPDVQRRRAKQLVYTHTETFGIGSNP